MFCLINYKGVDKPLPWDGLIVEVGFGRGEFLLKLARDNPEKKVLGFELSGISIEKLLKKLRREKLRNVHCTRIDAYWGFHFLLRDGSVERIYINYPDPWFKKRDYKRRLTTRKNLYMFHRKMKQEGVIRIRTDYRPFAEFSLEEAEWLGGFDTTMRELSVKEPLTKYERRWLSEGKKLYELALKKSGETRTVETPKVKEVKELFPVKVEGRTPQFDRLENVEEKLEDRVYTKFFRSYTREGVFLIETLLSEEGFTQKFFIEARRKGEHWLVDVSPHSEVLRTENLKKVVQLVAERGFKP